MKTLAAVLLLVLSVCASSQTRPTWAQNQTSDPPTVQQPAKHTHWFWPWHHHDQPNLAMFRVQRDLTRTAIANCSAAFILRNSLNPVDIMPVLLGAGYAQADKIDVCVILPNGHYGVYTWRIKHDHSGKNPDGSPADRFWIDDHYTDRGIFTGLPEQLATK